MDKNILKSKTFWMNLVMAVSALFPPVAQFISENPAGVAGFWALVSWGLRLITKDGVKLLP